MGNCSHPVHATILPVIPKHCWINHTSKLVAARWWTALCGLVGGLPDSSGRIPTEVLLLRLEIPKVTHSGYVVWPVVASLRFRIRLLNIL